ncbi:MFS transporter [Arenibaculum sp.]|uniref:MFS transporter n=1 Tax=Arenibaculum sp. TaxID=2865862 RepID=UPI002E0E37D4|nr:MFS transporter [Arenibaculum sp.]
MKPRLEDRSRADAPSTLRITLTVFLPFALGYFLSYLFRTVNAVIAEPLTAELGFSAAALGLLTSAYFVTFAAFQMPLGILLDRFGPRRVEAALLLVAAAGAAVFATGDGIVSLATGRALIGLGVSACLMAAFKANVMWWPKEKLPLVNGCFLAAGGSGAVFATTPVAALLEVTDWRGLFLGLAAVTLLAAILIWLVVPERDGGGRREGLGEQVRAAGRIYASGTFWKIVPAFVLQQGVFLAYLGLWAGPWFRDVSGLDRDGVAEHLQYTAIAMVVGFLTLGALAERLSRLGIRPIVVAGTAMGFCALSGILLVAGVDQPLLLWVSFAYLGSASSLSYAILSQSYPPELAGRVNTAVNMLVFILAFVLQAGIGSVIELFDPIPGGYSPVGHRAALGMLVAAQVASLVWLVWPTPRHTTVARRPA